MSQIALFSRILYLKTISQYDYVKVKNDFDKKYRLKQEEEKPKEMEKLLGVKKIGATPKPITSPLLLSRIQTAFHEGVINEYDVSKMVNISPDKLEKFLQ